MKPNLAVMLICLSLVSAVQASSTSLPGACGDDKVKFDVTADGSQLALVPPAPGKAQIVFIETMEKGGMAFCIGCDVVTRVGIDGAWVGANKGNSYFTLDVAPGDHHLCVDWQSAFGKLKQKVGMDELMADPGYVYYYRIKVRLIQMSDSYTERTLDLVPLRLDEANYLLQQSSLSTSTPQK